MGLERVLFYLYCLCNLGKDHIMALSDYQAKFQEKLRTETGVGDLIIKWDTYHRTPPVYFKTGDPSVCSSFADLHSEKLGGKFNLLIYGALRGMCHKKVHFSVYRDCNTIKVSPFHKTDIHL